jgi:hypothetical protein
MKLALFAILAAPAFPQALGILEANCLGCHNQKLRLSGLSMATRDDLVKGGKRGPGLEKIAEVIRHDGNLRMPPGRKLADAEIAAIQSWIRSGAAFPTGHAARAVKPNHWSFKTVTRPTVPQVKNRAWVRNPIDAFILGRLEKENIAPSPEAHRDILRRRMHLDITGLLPVPGSDAGAEQLFDSPHFGERWGRVWLDQARYADSDGGSRDEPRQIWRYRDWVIEAINRDMPFDQFVVEQLAGDLLPNPTQAQLIATGFHRNSPIQIEAGTDREQYRVEAVVDRVDTTGTVFLGLSAGCARCHDHKYDPISQREYYQLFAFFNSTDDWDNTRPTFATAGDLGVVHAPLLHFSGPAQVALRERLLTEIVAADAEVEKLQRAEDPKQHQAEMDRLNARLRELRKQIPKLEWAMVMRELAEPRKTKVMLGGDYLRTGDEVQPATPAFLHDLPSGGRPNRLDFARWLVDPANPLLARVTVNRIWQHYFGRGIVETENDFGTQGTPPTHPELLDWLAAEFVESGWSQKRIHRLIADSAAYRQSSNLRRDLSEKDPRNLLLARQNRLRLDAEIVRDIALSASGLLNAKIGGPSVYPPQPANAMQASQIPKTWKESSGPDRYRRGMYTFFYRITPNPALAVFDAPTSMNTCTRRTRSNTPLQALTLLNDAAFYEMARALAARIVKEGPADDAGRLRLAYQLTAGREASQAEARRMRALLDSEREEPWPAVARVLMNTDEFITRE